MRKIVLITTIFLMGASSFGQSSPDSVSGNSALMPNNAVRDTRVIKKQEIEEGSKRNPRKIKKQNVYNNSLSSSERSKAMEKRSQNPPTEKQWRSSKVPSVAQRQPR
jgi:hypothetical protein